MTKANEGSQNQPASDRRHNPETPHPHVSGSICNTERYPTGNVKHRSCAAITHHRLRTFRHYPLLE